MAAEMDSALDMLLSQTDETYARFTASASKLERTDKKKTRSRLMEDTAAR